MAHSESYSVANCIAVDFTNLYSRKSNSFAECESYRVTNNQANDFTNVYPIE